MSRPSWDAQFMAVAKIVAQRATCDRAHVGCVLAVDNRVVSTGYNGSLPGTDHCDDAGHLMVDGHCCRTVHAESNAIADAAKRGVSVAGAISYCTHTPCVYCCKLLIAAGVVQVVYSQVYGDVGVQQGLCVESKVRFRSFVPQPLQLREALGG